MYIRKYMYIHREYIRICKSGTIRATSLPRCVCATHTAMYTANTLQHTLQHTLHSNVIMRDRQRGGGLGSRPKKMYGERLGDGVEYHLMKPTPRR